MSMTVSLLFIQQICFTSANKSSFQFRRKSLF